MLELGPKPETLRLVLVNRQAFIAELELYDEDDTWGATAPAIVFESGQAWISTLLSQKVARFEATKEQVAAAVAGLATKQGADLVYGEALLARCRQVEVL